MNSSIERFSPPLGLRLPVLVSAAAALLAISLLPLLPAMTARAQAPSAAQMIEQLKTQPTLPAANAPANAPRTRSLRNLTVEAVNPAASTATTAGAATAASAGVAAATASPVQAAASVPAPAEPARPSLSLLIQFDFNSARVKPESQQALANLAAALKSEELKTFRFAVEGHTDAQGRADYNQKLSQQRADAVRDQLSSQGVASARLSPVGKGSSELAKPDEPYSAENRRVRIVNMD